MMTIDRRTVCFGGLLTALLLVTALGGGCRRDATSDEAAAEEATFTTGALSLPVAPGLAVAAGRWARTYHDLYPKATLTVRTIAPRDAVIGLLKGTIPAALLNRELLTDEQGQLAQVTEKTGRQLDLKLIAYDAVVVLLHPSDARLDSGLSLTDLGRAAATDGSATGALVLLPAGNTAAATEVRRRFLGGIERPLPAYAAVCTTATQMIAEVGRRPGSVGFIELSTLRVALGDTSGARQDALADISPLVRVAKVRPDSVGAPSVRPTPADVLTGLYPLRLPVYLYTTAPTPSLARGLSSFLLSQPGRKHVLDVGLVPTAQPQRVIRLGDGGK